MGARSRRDNHTTSVPYSYCPYLHMNKLRDQRIDARSDFTFSARRFRKIENTRDILRGDKESTWMVDAATKKNAAAKCPAALTLDEAKVSLIFMAIQPGQ